MIKTSVKGLSLRDLEYAKTIASEGHFGRAAALCGVSQPAISSQIQKLEARIGFAIFERHGKSISVTENGRIFVQKANNILSEAQELLELSSSLTAPMQGELRLGIIPTIGPYLVPLVLKPIKAAYPRLKLTLTEEPTHILEEMLIERQLDVIILATQPTSSNMEQIRLFFEPYLFACPSSEGFQHNTSVSWRNVRSTKLVMLTEEHCMRGQTIALCDITADSTQRMASSVEMLRQMVALGDGAALLPALSVRGPDPFGGLVTLHQISDGTFGRTVSLLFRKSDPRSEHLASFGKFWSEQMNAPEIQAYLRV